MLTEISATVRFYAGCHYLAFLLKTSIILGMERARKYLAFSGAPSLGLVSAAVALLLIGWLLNTPAGLLGKADAVGYAVCHRIDLRSFHLGVRQIPLCARCTGMYLGALLGLGYQYYLGRRRAGSPPVRVILILVILGLGFFIDGANSFLSLILPAPLLYEPQNWLRLVTGTGMGIVIAAALYPAFNQTVWADWDKRPALPGLRQLFGLLALAALLVLMVSSENPLVLYPLALISAAGVLVLLALVYMMVLLIVLRKENQFMRLPQMAVFLVGGLGMGVVQIILLDLGRYLLTGTWDGFHLG